MSKVNLVSMIREFTPTYQTNTFVFISYNMPLINSRQEGKKPAHPEMTTKKAEKAEFHLKKPTARSVRRLFSILVSE